MKSPKSWGLLKKKTLFVQVKSVFILPVVVYNGDFGYLRGGRYPLGVESWGP